MLVKRINRASPEQMFIAVRNNDSVTVSTGNAVVYDYLTGGTTGDGYSVRYARTTATSAVNPGHFAGLVAGRDIAPQDYGSIQVYGHTDYVVVTGTNSTGFQGLAATWTNASLSSIILRPVNALCVPAEPTGTLNGYLGAVYLTPNPIYMTESTSTTSVTVVSAWRAIFPGGYVVPLDSVYNTTGTQGSITTNQSGTCKGFIRCLG